jgi:hypothetical protein
MGLMQFLVIALLGLQVLIAASPPAKKPADPTVLECFDKQEVKKAECTEYASVSNFYLDGTYVLPAHRFLPSAWPAMKGFPGFLFLIDLM